MDASQIDRIGRILANHRLSRRRALAHGGFGLVTGTALAAGLAPATSSAQNATPVAGDDVELLFVQSFGGGAIAPGADGGYTLTLEGGLGETIYFSDRPNRVVGAMPTSEFITLLEAAIVDDPPNAALVAGDMILIAELTSASLDEATWTPTYDVLLLGEEDVDMQLEHAVAAAPTEAFALGTCHLFIDGIQGCTPIDPRC